MSFFNCHNHTHYSNLRLIDCINKPKDLIDKAIQLGLSGIAITDHEALSAHIEVNQYMNKIHEKYPDFKIALGNEIYLTETREPKQNYYHFILIAKDAEGHKALRILSSKAWYNMYYFVMERVPTLKSEVEEVMKEYKGHVIGTTACIGGELSQCILDELLATKAGLHNEEAHQRIHHFINWGIDTFGKSDFYIECAPGESQEQIEVNRQLYLLARQYGLKMVVGTDSHYLSKELRFAHKAYLNSKDGEREVDAFYEYAYLMDENECRQHLLASFPEGFAAYGDPENFDIIKWIFDNTNIMRFSIKDYSLERPQQIPMVSINPPDKSEWWEGNEMDNYAILKSLFMSDNLQERQWINDVWDALNEKIGYWSE